MNEQMKQLRDEIEQALNDERVNLEEHGEVMNEPGRCQGWIEALEYVLNQIDTRHRERIE